MITLFGLAVPYDVPAQIGSVPWLTEIAPGAFDVSLTARRVAAWANHNKHAVIAQQADGTLTLVSAVDALYFSLSTTRGSWPLILQQASDMGVLRGASVGWCPDADRIRAEWPTPNVRRIVEADLVEVSICVSTTRPAFPGTSARVTRRYAAGA